MPLPVHVHSSLEWLFERTPEPVRTRLRSGAAGLPTGGPEQERNVRHAGFEASVRLDEGAQALVIDKLRPVSPVVLVVDDDAEVRGLVCELLNEAGYATFEAQHGADALGILEHGVRPSLVLLDLQMPVMSGPQLLEALRGRPELRDIPVVVMSAPEQRPTLIRGFLPKPFELTHLLEVVRRHCGPSAGDPLDFQLLFESVPGLYLVLEPDLTIVAASNGYLRATMTTREGLIGRGMFEAFPDNPEDPAADGVRNLRSSLERVLRHRVPDPMPLQRYAIRRPASEGGSFEERWWSPVNSPVFAQDRRIRYIIHRVEDVTEFVQLQRRGAEDQRQTEELKSRAAKMEAEIFARARELEETRRRAELEQLLIGIVSHDLRSPIQAVILGAATLLRRNALNERQRETINRILGSADRATRLIHDLLDFTKARVGGGIPVERTRGDLHEIAQQVIDDVQLVRPERELRLEHSGEATGLWDADRVSQLLENLVTNALSYSPADSAVQIRTRGEGEAVTLSVHNLGAPIPADRLPTLFEPLNRGAKPGGQSRSIGLGLYISREIAQAHGGRIEVRSTAEAGTTLTVTLPRQR